MQGNVSSHHSDGYPDDSPWDNRSVAGQSSAPTDYISALEHYGSLGSASECSRCDLQTRPSFGSNAVMSDVWDLCNSSFDGGVYQTYDPAQSAFDLNVLNCSGIFRQHDERVVLPVDERCDACLGTLDTNVWVCSSCRISVHSLCYIPYDTHLEHLQRTGVSAFGRSADASNKSRDNRLSDSDGALKESVLRFDFVCDVCADKSLKQRPKCVLCGLSEGAMRYSTSDSVWVHCSCVVFAPSESNLKFKYPISMLEPQGVEEALESCSNDKDAGNKCDACGNSYGILRPCAFTRCSRNLHPRCALFCNGYQGTAFSDHVYYKTDERPQYIGFTGAFCNRHATWEFVSAGLQMHIRRSHVIREENASSYCRYQNEVANILRMTSAVTASAMMADGGAPTDAAATNLDMHIEPCVALPSEIEFHVGADAEPDEHSLDEWRQYFLEPRDTEACDSEVPQLIPTVTDEIDINMEINTNVEYDVLPVVEMHTGQGDMGADSNNSQFRGQRMIWQKSDVFRPIPYGPASDILMENQDQPTRKRSLEECPNLETTVLAGSDFLEPRDLSDMFLQQILYSCGGIVALLDAVKQNLDREVQGNGKSASDKKYARFHILVDTGRTAGFVVLRISKWLLEVIHDDHVLAQRSDKAPVSAVSIALDEEVRHFLSHVNAESNRNVSSAHSYFGNTLTRNVDLMSGFGEYGLKEDIRSLHAAANVSNSDADTLRLRKKLVKRAKNEQSLKSVELEDFIILSPLESELLRRCAFEMSHVNDTNIKLAVVKHTMEASDDIPSLLMVDWNSILSKIKASAAVTHSKNGQKGSNSKSTQTNVKNERPVNKTPVTPKSQQPSLEQSNSLGNLPPVPMVHLGKHTWPVVDDMNFVKGQKEITERDLTVVSSQLRTIRENIRENVLELNARLPTINERHGYADTLLEQYESTERWATVVNNFCKGLNDSTDNKTPTIYTHKSAAPVVLATSASEARAAAMKAEGIAEGAYCSVCFINTGNNLNPILTCSRCFMSAHRNCYGVSRNMKPAYAVDYVCRRCEYERRGMGSHWQTAFRSCSVVCAICGRGGGALKRCETDEWAHVFCLLALLPETRCINFVHMEPWSIQGIAAWRRDVICTVCGVDWGYVMGCSDCSAAAHPLCAWLHGFKFMPSAAMVYRAYLSRGHGLTRDLRVRLQCNGHDPERQWHVFISTRNKRFVNRDSAAYLFEGRDKRKKSRALVIEGMASMESLDLVDIRSTLCDTKQFMTDRRCAVCFGGGGTIATCSHCDRMAHYSCYVENDRDSITTDLGWGPLEFICDPCRNNDEEALCGICSQNVGLLKQVPTENNQRLYIHTICGVCFPRVLVSLYRGIPVDTTDTLPCTVCNSVDGMLLQCCQEGCSTMFHAYCGLESRYVVEAHCIDIARGPQYVAFCQQHALVSRSVGTNLKLLLRLRIYLQMLRALTTDMASQDAVVRAWRRKRQELLNLECPLTALINTRFDNSHE